MWLAWCEYVAVRKQRRDQRREAQEWYNGHMVRLAWDTWRRAIVFSLQQMAAETLAHQCWVHSLQRRVCRVCVCVCVCVVYVCVCVVCMCVCVCVCVGVYVCACVCVVCVQVGLLCVHRLELKKGI